MKTIILLLFCTSLFITVRAQVPSYVPSQNLTAWYSFDGNTADSSGNSNNFVNNGAALTTDRNGNPNSAYLFDGTNDYMIISAPSFQFGETSSFTISFWSYHSNTVACMPFNSGYTQGNGGTGKFCQFFAFQTPPGAQYRTNKQSTAWQIAQINNHAANVWENWVCVYDNKSMIVYKNGVQAATGTYTSSGAVTATMPFRIATNLLANGSFLSGKLDDIGIWHRALTLTEISNLYNTCDSTIIGGTSNISSCDTYASPNGKIYNATGIYTDTLISSQGCDSVVTLNLTINQSTIGSLTATGCNSYTSPSGTQTWGTSGTYTDIIPNAMGCDSVITVSLTIYTVDIAVFKSSNTLTSNANNAIYQWIDCDNNNALIPGATNQIFHATANGNYAVIVTENNCIDTSICFAITEVGFEEINGSANVSVIPNPSSGIFKIVSDTDLRNSLVKVYDISGKLVYTNYYGGKEIKNATINLTELQKGVYYLQLSSDKEHMTKKVIIN